MNKPVYSVSDLSSFISEVLQGSFFHNICIRGEINQLSKKGKFTYITLIDSNEQGENISSVLNVVIGPYCDVLATSLNVGDIVLMSGNLTYYKARGTVSFWPSVIKNDGEGQELIRLEKLKQKLHQMGVFDPLKKKELPRIVHNLAVVTSNSGAVINDIRSTLKSRFPVKIKVYSALVQGNEASNSLIKALDLAIKDEPDLIILARGGGSKSDLAPFNNEELVLKVFNSPIPIISAVGHQVDTSLTDLAADKSAITPTEAATMVGLSLKEVEQNHINYRSSLKSIISRRVDLLNERYLSIKKRFELSSPSALIKIKEKEYQSYREKLKRVLSERYGIIKNRLEQKKLLLASSNPLNILEKGYAYVYKGENKVTSIEEIKEEDLLKVFLRGGELEVIVKGKKKYE